jgi:type II secretory pathway pseudopilin PulG
MNKKGFIFVETIIVIVVLITALIIIYSSFLGVLDNEKRRSTFNNTSYLYQTYYIENFITSLNIKDYIDAFLKNPSSPREIIGFDCGSQLLYDTSNNVGEINKVEQAKQSFCENIINKEGKFYITNYDVNNLKQCTLNNSNSSCNDADKETIKNMDTNFIYYLRTLSGTSNDTNKYRLIGVYEETSYDNNNTVELNSQGSCPTGYEKKNPDDKLCVKKNTIKYYSNVELDIKDDSKVPRISLMYYQNNVLTYDISGIDSIPTIRCSPHDDNNKIQNYITYKPESKTFTIDYDNINAFYSKNDKVSKDIYCRINFS